MKKQATQRCHLNILKSEQNFQPKDEKTVRLIKQTMHGTFVSSDYMVECFSNSVYSIKTQEETVLNLFYFKEHDYLVTLELRDCSLPFLWIYKSFESAHRFPVKNINMKPSIQNLELNENCCGLGLNELNYSEILLDQVDDLLFIKTDQIYCMELTETELLLEYKLKTKIDDEMTLLRFFKLEEAFYCIIGTASNIYICKIVKVHSNIVEFVLLEEAEKKLTCNNLTTVVIEQRDVEHDFGRFSRDDLGLSLLGIVGCAQQYKLKIANCEDRVLIFITSDRSLRILEVTGAGLYDFGLFNLFHKGKIMDLHICTSYFIIQTDLDGIFLYFYLLPDKSPIKPSCPYSRVLAESGVYFYDNLLQDLNSQYENRCQMMDIKPPFSTNQIVANLSAYLQQIELIEVFVYNLTPETAIENLIISADQSSFSYLLEIDDLFVSKSITLESLSETVACLNENVQALETCEELSGDIIDMKVHALGEIVMYGCLFRENEKEGKNEMLPQIFCSLVENAVLLTKSDRESTYLLFQLGLSKFGGFPEVSQELQSTVKIPLNQLAQFLALAPVKLGILLCLYDKPVHAALGLQSPFDFESFDAILEVICNQHYQLKKPAELQVEELDFRKAKCLIQANLATVYAGNIAETNRAYQAVQSIFICIKTLIQTVLLYGQTRIRICGDVLSALPLIDQFLNCSFEQCIDLVFFGLCNHENSDMKEFVTETTVDELHGALGILVHKARKCGAKTEAKAAYINICLSVAIQAINCKTNIELGDTERLVQKNRIEVIEILQKYLIEPIKTAINSMYSVILRFFCEQYYEIVVEAVVLDIKLRAGKITLETYIQPFYQQECLHEVMLAALIQINNQNVQIEGLEQQLLFALTRIEAKTIDIVDRTLALRSDSVRSELERLRLSKAQQYIMNQFVDDPEIFRNIYQEFSVLDGYIQSYFLFSLKGDEEAIIKMWKTSKYLTALTFAKKIDQALCLRLFGDEKEKFMLVLQMMDNLQGIQSPLVKYIE